MASNLWLLNSRMTPLKAALPFSMTSRVACLQTWSSGLYCLVQQQQQVQSRSMSLHRNASRQPAHLATNTAISSLLRLDNKLATVGLLPIRIDLRRPHTLARSTSVYPAMRTPLLLQELSKVQQTPTQVASSETATQPEAQAVLNTAFRQLFQKYKLEELHVPREVVWLNGAPGAGKGANTKYIMQTRGLTRCISTSSLLQENPATRAAIARGDLVPESLVVQALLEALLVKGSASQPALGVLVDGFPRTALQVEILKLLHSKLVQFHTGLTCSPALRDSFPKPAFRLAMLYVDEETSVARQMERGRAAVAHNQRMLHMQPDKLREVRSTDCDAAACRKRYAIFKQHYPAVLKLKEHFTFHLADAMGSMADTQAAIQTELRYQSELELPEQVWKAIKALPTAAAVATHARQQLPRHLDAHSKDHGNLVMEVLDILHNGIMPVLECSGGRGRAEYLTEAALFSEQPLTLSILRDIMADRGFKVLHKKQEQAVPACVCLKTGVVSSGTRIIHRFEVTWDVNAQSGFFKVKDLEQQMQKPEGDAKTDAPSKDGAQNTSSTKDTSYKWGLDGYLFWRYQQ